MSSRSSYRKAVRSTGSVFYVPSPTDTENRSVKSGSLGTVTKDAMNNNEEDSGTDTLERYTASLIDDGEANEQRPDSGYYVDGVLYDIPETYGPGTSWVEKGGARVDTSTAPTAVTKPGVDTSTAPTAVTKPVPHQVLITELTQKLEANSEGRESPDSEGLYDDVPIESSRNTLTAGQASNTLYGDVTNGTQVSQRPIMLPNELYHTLDTSVGGGGCRPACKSDTLTSEDTIYEPVDYPGDDVDGSWRWASDEFEESTATVKSPGFMQKLAGSLRIKKPKNRNLRGKSFQIDLEKHPPPELPPCPEGLTDKQQKRRHIVGSIIEIENSYLNSLISLLENYKRPLLENGLIPSERVECIFYKLDDILDCHLMFRVALHERIRSWDDHEQIGDEFSGIVKELVLECYSEFINNYMTSNDLLKKSLKEKNVFGDFINGQMKKSKELIGPRDQMIKVVQRFPQYILQIKDLIKSTPPDHDDYMKLNIALSKLENVAYQLNEKKRASEEKLAAKVIFGKLWGSKGFSDSSILLRQDDVTEVSYNSKGEIVYQKGRRLLLFNDMICLIKIENSGSDERVTSKWKCAMKYVEYQESRTQDSLRSLVKGNTGSMVIQSNTSQRRGSDSSAAHETAALVHKELDDLMHDQAVLGKIMALTSSLRQEYKGLNVDMLTEQLKNVQMSIRLGDEQLQMLDSCVISLSYIKNNQRVQSMFHMASPACKQDWVMDFRAVKLAQDSVNHVHRCWLTEEPKRNYPLVIRNVNVDVTSTRTQVTCATPIFLTNSSGGIGLQYLWVCSNNQEHGQVTLLSIHANKPHIIESFKACNGAIDCCLLVPSNVHSALDHMWMADDTNSVYVHGLKNGDWRSNFRRFSIPARVKDMCCYGEYVFLGLNNSTVLKYAKRKGSSLYSEPDSQRLCEKEMPVSCLLPSENNKIVAACGNTLFVLSTINDLKVIEKHELSDSSLCIDKMVRLGYGIWFSCTGDPSLRLIHHETYNSISEVHIGNALAKLLPTVVIDGADVSITALTTSQGLIWVGTNTGHILTIPVPMLEGIPQQSGRVNVSSLSHRSPVKFISTIQCSITFAPRALSEEDLESMNSIEEVDEASDPDSDNEEYVDFEAEQQLNTPARQNSLVKMRQKMAERSGGNLLKQSRAFALSTPNLAFNRMGDTRGLQRVSHGGMYDSLMKLNDFDTTLSTTDLVSNLVPTNQLPIERFCTKISTQRGSTKLKVTRSSSISQLTSQTKPLSKSRKGVQSMWSLSTTSSHSIHSLPRKPGDAAVSADYTSLNMELKAKLGSKLSHGSLRDSRTLSVNSLLSRVAEDDEYIFDDQLSPLEESDDFDYSSYTASETPTIHESEEEAEEQQIDDTDEQTDEEALVFTNFLKASLIVSGGEGFLNLHDELSNTDESTLIMWQQNQTWT